MYIWLRSYSVSVRTAGFFRLAPTTDLPRAASSQVPGSSTHLLEHASSRAVRGTWSHWHPHHSVGTLHGPRALACGSLGRRSSQEAGQTNLSLTRPGTLRAIEPGTRG